MGFMSDKNGGAGGSHIGKGDSTRVGNAERDAAIALLGDHWRAGRLDPAEHELRVTRARAAVTRADLDALFADLPPAGPAPDSSSVATSETVGSLGMRGSTRDTIMALAPFAALVLFFVTHTWLWFLLVPVMGILLYGSGGNRGSRQRGR